MMSPTTGYIFLCQWTVKTSLPHPPLVYRHAVDQCDLDNSLLRLSSLLILVVSTSQLKLTVYYGRHTFIEKETKKVKSGICDWMYLFYSQLFNILADHGDVQDTQLQ